MTEQVKEFSVSNNKEESITKDNPGDLACGTAIKIRTRFPQQQLDSDNLGAQGSAPRRICLQMNTLPGSIVNDDVRDVKQNKQGYVMQSAVSEVKITSDVKASIFNKVILCAY